MQIISSNRTMKFLHYNHKIMTYGAVMPLDKNSSIPFKIYFYIFRLINFFVIFWIIGISLFYYVFVDQSFGQLFGVINGMVYVGAAIRMTAFYLFDEEVLKVVKAANGIFKKISQTGIEEISISPEIRAANVGSLILVIFCWIVAGFFAIFPILLVDNRDGLVPLWYPYDINASPYFELSAIFQLLSQCSMSFTYNCADTFFVCLMVATAGQFKILACEMENVCFTALLSCGFDREEILNFKENLPFSRIIAHDDDFYEIYEFMETPRYAAALRTHLTDVIIYHKDILGFCDLLESLLSPVMLTIFLSTLSHLVLILYGISLSTSLEEQLQSVGYLLGGIWESFLMAFSADLLVRESSKLQFALYSTPWYLCPKTIKKTFLICHLRLKTNVGLSLGKFTTFDLQAYTWVLKTSFSYYTVLSSKNDNLA